MQFKLKMEVFTTCMHRDYVNINCNKVLKMISLLQRRCSLEDWMEKLLSDIDISRSAPVAMFLELEAAVRSCRCFLDAFFK